MTLKDITGWGMQGKFIADDDVSENANIQRAKLGTRTEYMSIHPTAGTLSGSTKTTDGAFSSLILPDSGGTTAYYSIRLPDDYVSGDLTFDIFWKTTATANNARFMIDFSGAAVGDSTGVATSPTVIQATNGTASRINMATITVAAANFAAGNIMGFVLSRDPANGSDTLATDLEVLLIRISYTARG